jgi:thiamine pyrophosphate-dependent acetolactate synthase large subunit-like protein
VPAAPAPDPAALANAADALVAAERPVVIADFAARPPHGWEHVIAIAETLNWRRPSVCSRAAARARS